MWIDDARAICAGIRSTTNCRSLIVQRNVADLAKVRDEISETLCDAKFIEKAKDQATCRNVIFENFRSLHETYIRLLQEEAMFDRFSDQDLIRQASEREFSSGSRHKSLRKRVMQEFGIDVSLGNIKKALKVKK
ncbi:MAG: hypothetical protein H0V63_02140 [Burkholderiaceae bacterium]|nr:hypothetical protein [Burkholderiaceae bacterium]